MRCSLREMNARGILVAPGESLEQFERRAALLEEIRQNPALLISVQGTDQQNMPTKLTYSDLDLDIDWLMLSVSKTKLSLWEPAATWIVELEGISIPVLQIKSNKHPLQEEILKHEAVHAARSAFNQPIYEEFLAYATSKSKWRKVLGPLFRSSKETIVFVVLSLLPLIGVVWLFLENLLYAPILMFLGYLIGRLCINYRVFKKTLFNIQNVFEGESALKIALRLSDREIQLFSSLNKADIRDYINKQKCLRWDQITSSYKLKKK